MIRKTFSVFVLVGVWIFPEITAQNVTISGPEIGIGHSEDGTAKEVIVRNRLISHPRKFPSPQVVDDAIPAQPVLLTGSMASEQIVEPSMAADDTASQLNTRQERQMQNFPPNFQPQQQQPGPILQGSIPMMQQGPPLVQPMQAPPQMFQQPQQQPQMQMMQQPQMQMVQQPQIMQQQQQAIQQQQTMPQASFIQNTQQTNPQARPQQFQSKQLVQQVSLGDPVNVPGVVGIPVAMAPVQQPNPSGPMFMPAAASLPGPPNSFQQQPQMPQQNDQILSGQPQQQMIQQPASISSDTSLMPIQQGVVNAPLQAGNFLLNQPQTDSGSMDRLNDVTNGIMSTQQDLVDKINQQSGVIAFLMKSLIREQPQHLGTTPKTIPNNQPSVISTGFSK